MALPIRLRTIAAAAVVIGSGLSIFYTYQSIIDSTDSALQAVPIIRADSEPFREVPEDPGGAHIPNQGSKLFNVLKEDNGDTLALSGVKIEAEEPDTILETIKTSQDEEVSGFELPVVPEKRTESLYGMIDDLKDDAEPVVDLDQEVVDVVKKDVPKIVEPDDALDVLDEAVEDITEAKDESSKDAEPEITDNVITPLHKPKPPVMKTVAEKPKEEEKKSFSLDRILKEDKIQKRYYIQLASVKNKSDAEALYTRVRDQFPKLVAGVNVFYPKADLGARGTFTRLQIGPFDQADAKVRCADYSASAKGGTCLVISR